MKVCSSAFLLTSVLAQEDPFLSIMPDYPIGCEVTGKGGNEKVPTNAPTDECAILNFNLGNKTDPCKPTGWETPPLVGQSVYLKDPSNFCLMLPDPYSKTLQKNFYNQGKLPTIVSAEGYSRAFCLGEYSTPGALPLPKEAIKSAHVIKNKVGSREYIEISGTWDHNLLKIDPLENDIENPGGGGQYDSARFVNCGKEPYSGVDPTKHANFFGPVNEWKDGLPDYVEKADGFTFCLRICMPGQGYDYDTGKTDLTHPCEIKSDTVPCSKLWGVKFEPGFTMTDMINGTGNPEPFPFNSSIAATPTETKSDTKVTEKNSAVTLFSAISLRFFETPTSNLGYVAGEGSEKFYHIRKMKAMYLVSSLSYFVSAGAEDPFLSIMPDFPVGCEVTGKGGNGKVPTNAPTDECALLNFNLGNKTDECKPTGWQNPPIVGQSVYLKDPSNFCLLLPDPYSKTLQKNYYDQGKLPTIVSAEGYTRAFCVGEYSTPGALPLPKEAIKSAHVIKNKVGTREYIEISGTWDYNLLKIDPLLNDVENPGGGGQYDTARFVNCGKEPYSGVDPTKHANFFGPANEWKDGLPDFVEKADANTFCMRICMPGQGYDFDTGNTDLTHPCETKSDTVPCSTLWGVKFEPGFTMTDMINGTGNPEPFSFNGTAVTSAETKSDTKATEKSSAASSVSAITSFLIIIHLL